MHFEARAVSADQFAAWIATVRGGGPSLDEASYRALERQSTGVEPLTYGAADPALFQKIVSQDIPPAPGPSAGLPSVDVSNRTGQ